jgi:hypothetical protein
MWKSTHSINSLRTLCKLNRTRAFLNNQICSLFVEDLPFKKCHQDSVQIKRHGAFHKQSSSFSYCEKHHVINAIRTLYQYNRLGAFQKRSSLFSYHGRTTLNKRNQTSYQLNLLPGFWKPSVLSLILEEFPFNKIHQDSLPIKSNESFS